MPTYQIVSADMITDDTGKFIPVDPLNADYQDYLAWVAEGNTATNFSGPSNTDPVYVFDNLDVGGSEIYNGTAGRVLYDNGGVLGELATTGSGSVVRGTSPTIDAPTLTGSLYAGSTPFEGNANDVLTSTGTSVEWNASSGVGDVVRSTNPTITDLQLAGYLDISGVGTGTSGQLLQSTGTGITWATATYLQPMEYSNASVTTADLTGSLNTIHYLDVSGMTANRTFTMPTATAAGQRCTVFLSTGSTSYALIIALGTNEYTRIFNNLECVSFISIGAGASAWILDIDKRIPCTARLTYTGASGQSITSGSVTQVTLNSSSFETLGINDTTNSRLKIRRSGKYHVTGNFRFGSITATIPRMAVSIRLTSGSVILQTSEIYALSTTSAPGIVAAGILDLTAGDTIELTVFQNSGSAQSTASSANYPTLAMTEILL